MRITDLINSKSIDLNAKATSKEEVINKAVDLMVKGGNIKDKEVYKKGVFAREAESTTGVGDGIAIPHCKSDAVAAPGLAAMVIRDGVDYDALDGQPVDLVFLIAAPNSKDNVHLAVLSKLSVLLMDPDFTKNLKAAKTPEEFLAVIDKTEQEKEEQENSTKEVLNSENTGTGKTRILAVTGCPTGIAHTFMAAESLQKKAEALGCIIKVETRGSAGAKNVLTAQEIEKADCIIVAADTKVPMERFKGKKLIECPVSDGISKADSLIKRAMDGDAPVYHGGAGDEDNSSSESTGSLGHRIYKHLMNGVSHMLPFVVGGGILIALAFLIDSMLIDINTADMSNFGSITPVAALFKGIGGTAFNFMLPILAGFISSSIADRPGLAPGFVGGAIAASGTSGFLGALVAGFLAGYTIVLLKKIFSGLPDALEGLKPVLLYPLLGILIVGIIMTFIVEPPVGALNTLLNNGLSSMSGTSKILLGIVLGGMMAVDLGGPVNKAAYVFGTAAITAGNYDIMAAVMIGGMVPPTGIALATLLFKNRFNEQERKSGPTNFVMGLSFITEGAIPFAGSDPLRVIPSCIAGSAVAGALSMAFGCTLRAPHGGIFVFPVVGNPLFYLIALAAGTVVTALLLGILKKNVEH